MNNDTANAEHGKTIEEVSKIKSVVNVKKCHKEEEFLNKYLAN